MRKKLPPLNWLRSFESSAKHLNFTLAANELHMTQAAISQQIKGLESQLGTPLFKRLSRGLELTEAGKAYMPVVHEAIERLNIATHEIFSQYQNHSLNIRVSLVFFTHWLAPKLQDFRSRNPHIQLKFSSNIWVGEQQQEADLEIRHGLGSWPGLTAQRLTWDELVPVCSPSYVSSLYPDKNKSTAVDIIQRSTLLHVLGYNEGWGHWLKAAGYSESNSTHSIQLDTSIMALELAAQNQGIALGRSSLIENMLSNKQLICAFPQKIPTSEAFYLVKDASKPFTSHADTFSQWLVTQTQPTSTT